MKNMPIASFLLHLDLNLNVKTTRSLFRLFPAVQKYKHNWIVRMRIRYCFFKIDVMDAICPWKDPAFRCESPRSSKLWSNKTLTCCTTYHEFKATEHDRTIQIYVLVLYDSADFIRLIHLSLNVVNRHKNIMFRNSTFVRICWGFLYQGPWKKEGDIFKIN